MRCAKRKMCANCSFTDLQIVRDATVPLQHCTKQMHHETSPSHRRTLPARCIATHYPYKTAVDDTITRRNCAQRNPYLGIRSRNSTSPHLTTPALCSTLHNSGCVLPNAALPQRDHRKRRHRNSLLHRNVALQHQHAGALHLYTAVQNYTVTIRYLN